MVFSKRLFLNCFKKAKCILKGNPESFQNAAFRFQSSCRFSKKLKKAAVSLLKLKHPLKPQHESDQFQLVKCIYDQYFLSYYGNYELRVYIKFGQRKLIFFFFLENCFKCFLEKNFQRNFFSRKQFPFIRNQSIRKWASLSRWTSLLSQRSPNFLLLNFCVVLHSRSLSCHLCINPSNSSGLISELRFA